MEASSATRAGTDRDAHITAVLDLSDRLSAASRSVATAEVLVCGSAELLADAPADSYRLAAVLRDVAALRAARVDLAAVCAEVTR